MFSTLSAIVLTASVLAIGLVGFLIRRNALKMAALAHANRPLSLLERRSYFYVRLLSFERAQVDVGCQLVPHEEWLAQLLPLTGQELEAAIDELARGNIDVSRAEYEAYSYSERRFIAAVERRPM